MEELEKGLLQFGLSDDEAKMYLLLVGWGSGTASNLARKLQVNRMKAYRTLRALGEKGFVSAIPERPLRFTALAPRESIEQYLANDKERILKLEAGKESLVSQLEKVQPDEPAVNAPRFRIVQGRQRVYDTLAQMYDKAKEEVNIITTRNDLSRSSFAGLDDLLRDRTNKNVAVRIIFQIESQGKKVAEEYGAFANVRHAKLLGNLRFIVVDGKQVLTTMAMDDSMSMTTQEDVNLWTDAISYVQGISSFFNGLWESSISADVRVDRLKSEEALIGTVEQAKPIIERKGWKMNIPASLVGDAGITHTLTAVVRNSKASNGLIIIDLQTEVGSIAAQTMALGVRRIDTQAKAGILLTFEDPTKTEINLGVHHAVTVVQNPTPDQLLKEVVRVFGRKT